MSGSGSCLCGSVNLEYNSEPNFFLLCHCTDCQKATGSPVASIIGIPEDEQEAVFERFHRASNATEHSGSGLGLSVVKLLVEGMGGRIGLRSRLGEGSCFTVRLAQ